MMLLDIAVAYGNLKVWKNSAEMAGVTAFKRYIYLNMQKAHYRLVHKLHFKNIHYFEWVCGYFEKSINTYIQNEL